METSHFVFLYYRYISGFVFCFKLQSQQSQCKKLGVRSDTCFLWGVVVYNAAVFLGKKSAKFDKVVFFKFQDEIKPWFLSSKYVMQTAN